MAMWQFEPGHSSAEFAVRHMMVTIVRGSYKNVRGVLNFDPADPASGSVEVIIDAGAFSTEERERDDHLRSADFFDVAKHPRIIFKSTQVEVSGFNHFALTGELTIRGITRPVTLHGQYWGPVLSPFGNTRMGFLATTRINREEFGVSWNSAMPSGGHVVGKYVDITIDVEAIRAD